MEARWPSLLSAVVSFIIYALTCSPSLYWLDSSEFVAASWTLGIAHPPGHPLAALLGRLLVFLPFGTLPFRISLASALLTAAACGFLAAIGDKVLHQAVPGLSRGFRQSLAFLSTLTPALSYAFWFQAIRSEVYALNVVLVLAILYLLLRWEATCRSVGCPRSCPLVAAGFLFGLGLCNHHLLMLLAAPAGLIFVLTTPVDPAPCDNRARRVFRSVLELGAGTATGLLLLLYLPLRATRQPLVNWGSPTSWSRFFWVVSAEAFQGKSAERALAQDVADRGAAAAFGLLGGPPSLTSPAFSGLVTLGLAMGGLYLLLRRRQTRRVGVMLGLVQLSSLASPLLVGFDAYNPDAYGYMALAVAVVGIELAVMLGVSLNVLRAGANAADVTQPTVNTWRASRSAPVFLLLVAGTLAVSQAFQNAERCNLRHAWNTEVTAKALLNQPPGSLLLVTYFQSVFATWAMQSVGDFRPDIKLVQHMMFGQVGYTPTPGALPKKIRLRWIKQGRIDEAGLGSLARDQPLRLEYGLSLPDVLLQPFGPAGLTLDYHFAESTRKEARYVDHRRRVRMWEDQLSIGLDHEDLRAAAWTHYRLAHFACRRGHASIAAWHLRRLLAIVPKAHEAIALRQNCRALAL